MSAVPSAVTLYDAAVAVHVIAVIAAFGVLFAYPWLERGTPAAHDARRRLLSVVVTRAATVALLVGMYLANDRGYLGQLWVVVPLAIMIVLLGVVGAYLTPAERRLGAMTERDPRRAALQRTVQRVAVVCAALVAVAAFFMVTKLGA